MMKYICLSNYGKRVQLNLSKLNQTYGDFAEIKRAKLSRIWENGSSMYLYEKTFTNGDRYLIDNGDTFHLIDPSSKQEEILPREMFSHVSDWERGRLLGIFEVKDQKTEADIIAGIELYNKTAVIQNTGIFEFDLRSLGEYKGDSKRVGLGYAVPSIKETLRDAFMSGLRYITFYGGKIASMTEDLLKLVKYSSDYMILKTPSLERIINSAEMTDFKKTLKDKDDVERSVQAKAEEIMKMLLGLKSPDKIIIIADDIPEIPKPVVEEFEEYGVKLIETKSIVNEPENPDETQEKK